MLLFKTTYGQRHLWSIKLIELLTFYAWNNAKSDRIVKKAPEKWANFCAVKGYFFRTIFLEKLRWKLKFDKNRKL